MQLFKNINVDGIARMCGKNWVATPFVLNFGYNHSYEDDYLLWEYEHGETCTYNMFGLSRHKFLDRIKYWLRPTNYKESIFLEDISTGLVGIPIKEYNYIQVLIRGDELWIVATWTDFKRKCNENIATLKLSKEDYLPIWYKKLDRTYNTILMTFCTMHFKYTAELYSKNFYLRLLKDCVYGTHIDNQYVGNVRLDSGKSENGKYERMSVIKSIEVPTDVAENCIACISKFHEGEVLEYDE